MFSFMWIIQGDVIIWQYFPLASSSTIGLSLVIALGLGRLGLNLLYCSFCIEIQFFSALAEYLPKG
jgi:hypothetical protein